MPFKEPVRKTLRAQWLGHLMRQLRHERGVTLKEAAEYIDRDHSALARYERAQWPFKRDDVLALLDIYGIDDPVRRSRILKLAEECWRVNEWDIDNADEVFNRGYVDHTWLEQHAKTICAYATQILPDLVQTPAYTARVIQLRERTRKPTDHQTRQVERHTARRHAFNTGGNTLEIVIDEAVLHTTAPEPGLMRDQFAHLADLTRNPRVTIRVLPADVTIAARAFGPFEVFLMPDPYPEVGYLDNLAGHIYVEAPHSKRFVLAYDQLRDAALDPAESAKMIMFAARDT